MSFNIRALIKARLGENLALHEAHINPAFAKVLRTIGFDKVYARGAGPYLYDREGNRYLDFLAGYGVFNLGRHHPTVRQALLDFLSEEAPTLVKMDAPLLAGLLAEELKKRLPPSLDKVYFTNSGAEGIETALKFARCATRRPRILYCDHSFHGLSYGALSITGESWFREGFEPLLPGCTPIPFNDASALEKELAKNDVAGFIIEPIQGKGVHVAPDEYLRSAAELCRKHGALFIVDEVQTGLGRSGKLFAFQYSGVEPDMVVISKALSGGYVPVGAVITRGDVHEKVFSSMDRCVVHSSTFSQGAMAMAAGLATLHVLDAENIPERARRLGDLMIAGLLDLQKRYEQIQELRGRGLMIGIEFGRPKSLTLKIGWDLIHKVSDGLFGQAIVIPLLSEHRILTQVAGKGKDVIKLLPALVISEADVSYFLECFETVLKKSHSFPGPIWEVATRLAKFALKRRE
ncbi:MAG: aspartate aminotransferase family protein [Planctomycetes bacterium]|nr:aspartate aminotransferase family protein [Planctomycetota bacterium]